MSRPTIDGIVNYAYFTILTVLYLTVRTNTVHYYTRTNRYTTNPTQYSRLSISTGTVYRYDGTAEASALNY